MAKKGDAPVFESFYEQPGLFNFLPSGRKFGVEDFDLVRMNAESSFESQ